MMKGFEFINLIVDRDRVFVTYEGHKANGRVFRNAAIVTVRQNQIIKDSRSLFQLVEYRMKPNLVASWKAMGIEIQTEEK